MPLSTRGACPSRPETLHGISPAPALEPPPAQADTPPMLDAAGTPAAGRADLHLHTTFSDGTSTPEEILNFCLSRTGLRVVAITDHDTIDGALRARRYAEENPDVFADMHVIVGEEVSTRDGHVIGLFLEEWIPPGMDAARTVAEIHRQGGIAIAAHPYTNLMKWNHLVGVGDLILSLPFDGVETRNSNFTEFRANRKAARNLGAKAQIGSSDGHFLESVGRCYTAFPGSSAEDLRSAILGRRTVAEGSCYGLRTLARFVARRIRAGQRVLPDRQRFWRESSDQGLAIEVAQSRPFDTAVVTPVGSLDDRALDALKSTLTRLADSGASLVVDLARVNAMTAHGVTALVAGFRAAQRQGVGFCLASPSRASLRALEGSLLQDHLPWSANLVEAQRRASTLALAPERAPA